VSLKNGSEIDAGWGITFWRALQSLLDQHPEHLQALLAIAKGRSEDAPARSVAFLRHGGLLLRDRTVNPDAQAVLLSAYQETAEGPVLVNPFRLDSPEQAQALESRDAERSHRLLRWLKRRENDEGRAP
jgi:hypothetical protein